MNIKQAKDYVKQTVQIYLKKDEFGEYIIPVPRQRPIFLVGAPGIGKTAIMEQVAQEMGLALVTYSMTHHTRQSALGLPYIVHKNFGTVVAEVSEYTMSEIIASVFETIQESDKKEGILFLDEINCVSETLAPAMLQFLQYKVFGRFQVPEGWVIVTAGNPPEYNKSVREFDVVTMDRLKVLQVEPDYTIWREYASNRGLHNAVLSFLDLKREYFYRIETQVHGKSYITARGWEDLSQTLSLYEDEGIAVDETLIGQYIKNETVTREFGAYYDLYNKYKSNYAVQDILTGNASEQSYEKAARAPFDERLSLLSILMDKTMNDIRYVVEMTDYLTEVSESVKKTKELALDVNSSDMSLINYFTQRIDAMTNQLNSLEKANALSSKDRRRMKRVLNFLAEGNREAHKITSMSLAAAAIQDRYNEEMASIMERSDLAQLELRSVFQFVARAFADGNEMLVLVTSLTSNKYSTEFISRFGSPEYNHYSSELMVTDEMDQIGDEIDRLNI